MQTAEFSIPALDASRVLDLENALIPLSGVARVHVTVPSRSVSVEYDPDFVNEKLIQDLIKNAGYSGANPGED